MFMINTSCGVFRKKCETHFLHSTHHYPRFWRCQEVDGLFTIYAYTDIDSGYQVSIRSADREYLANEVAEKLCDGIGSGGGHIDKAGGVISRDCICESYAGWEIADIIKERMEKIMK